MFTRELPIAGARLPVHPSLLLMLRKPHLCWHEACVIPGCEQM